MGYPEITEDQRAMAVELLANALRKDAYLRARAHASPADASPVHAGMARRRAEPSQRYVDGMRDLLRALFRDGHAVADACVEEAYARAMGVSAPVRETGNGTQDH